MAERKTILIMFLLRFGLAFTFLYAGIGSFLHPEVWVGFFPPQLEMIAPLSQLLPLFSIYELVLALWLLSGRWLFYASLLTAATMLGIVIANFSSMDIVFRDLGLFFAALELCKASYSKNK